MELPCYQPIILLLLHSFYTTPRNLQASTIKVSTTLALLFANLPAVLGLNSSPIEQTLQQLERNAKAWYDWTQNQPYTEVIAHFANLRVKETIEEIRKAVKDMARLLVYARIFIEENRPEKAKVNIEAALEVSCLFIAN